MFPMTVTIHNPEQLNAVLGALALRALDVGAEHTTPPATNYAAPAPRPSAAVTPEKQEAARASAKVAQDAQAAENSAAKHPPAEGATPLEKLKEAVAAEPKALTYEADVKPTILKLAKEKGRPAAEGALAKFGVKGGTELKETQYVDFVAHVQSLLAA